MRKIILLLFCALALLPTNKIAEAKETNQRIVFLEVSNTQHFLLQAQLLHPSKKKANLCIPRSITGIKCFEIAFPKGEITDGETITFTLQEKGKEKIEYEVGFGESEEKEIGEFSIKASFLQEETPVGENGLW